MRLGPFELRRAAAAQAPPVPRTRGATGTVNQDGYIVREEWNPELLGKEALRVYRKMRTDPTVREAEQHLFAPIKNATWEIQPASDSPEDLEVAAAVRMAYFDWAKRPFQQHLHQALTGLSYGFQVFEYAWQVVEDEVAYDDPDSGEEVTVPGRQYVTFHHFSQRLPETIWKWNAQDSELVSVVQHAMRNGVFEELEMDARDLLVFTNEQEGDDFEGQPLLRAAYAPWFLKRLVERVMGVAVERHALGTWLAYPQSTQAGDEDELNRLEEILTAQGLGDSPYIIAPGPKATATMPGYLLELVTPQGQLPDFVKTLEYLRGEIKGTVLARFSELGHGQTGARATGDTQSEVWYDALHAAANWFAGVHNTFAIPRFVAMNFGDRVKPPKLVAQNIESRSLEEFANAHYRLVASGAIVADTSYRQFIRREMGAPDEDEDTAEQLAEQEQVEDEPPPPKTAEPDPDDTPEED
jgi:hypothetical protein